MKNFKKVLSSISIIGLVLLSTSSLVNAAAINDSTAVVTAGTWIVVNSTTGGFGVNGTDTCTATITKTNTNNTTTSVTVDSCTVTDTNNLTIGATTVAANEYYTITFTTSQNVYGSTTVWDTTNNVSVSARVLPILTMSLTNPVVDLGVLTDSAISDSTNDTTITIKTNAANWYVVSAAATNFKGTDTNNVIPFVTRSAQSAWTEWFSIDVASVGQWTNGTSTVDATASLDTASTYAVANASASLAWATGDGSSVKGTTDWDTVVVNYAAAISPVTESDSYSTTVTFSITATY